jgi:hypothetical protein
MPTRMHYSKRSIWGEDVDLIRSSVELVLH